MLRSVERAMLDVIIVGEQHAEEVFAGFGCNRCVVATGPRNRE